MRTSELPVGSILKFKNSARVHSFYDRMPDTGWTHDQHGSLKYLEIGVGDLITIMKTSTKEEHVGQTVVLPDGQVKVLYYRKDTFFDMNEAVVAGVNITAHQFYYDVISP